MNDNETDPQLVVVDRAGSEMPYSRGIMANSLLATGVTTEHAHRLSRLVQGRFATTSTRRMDIDELVAMTCEVLADDPTRSDLDERWMAWRRARRTGRPLIVVLGGAPGSGKSTLATSLAVRLDITRVVTTDAMREVLRVVVPPTVLPELHASTYELIDFGRAEPFAGFDRQCSAVIEATAAVANRLATEHRSMIIEGVHVVPGALAAKLGGHASDPIVVERLIEVDENRHREHLDGRGRSEPLRGATRYHDGFDTLRATQEHLMEIAATERVPIVDIHAAAELTQNIVDEIAAQAGGGVDREG